MFTTNQEKSQTAKKVRPHVETMTSIQFTDEHERNQRIYSQKAAKTFFGQTELMFACWQDSCDELIEL